METEAESIRRAIEARPKLRYSDELKGRILHYVRGRRGEGATQQQIVEELGVKWQTIRRWMEVEHPPTAMVPVTLRESPGTARDISLVSPTGYRLEGLSDRHAVALFREL